MSEIKNTIKTDSRHQGGFDSAEKFFDKQLDTLTGDITDPRAKPPSNKKSIHSSICSHQTTL